MRTGFPQGVADHVQSYVYLLLDPRTSPPEPFYVGKGVGNRIFAHLRAALVSPADGDKLARIRSIRQDGFEVEHVVLRHGLGPECAAEVEAALIDFFANLTNIAGGYHSSVRGLMTIEEVIAEYEAPPATISEAGIIVKINRLYRRGMTDDELYEVTRKRWVIGARRHNARFAFAVAGGIIRQVYVIDEWYPSVEVPNRWEFRGHKVPELHHYIGCSVASMFKHGEAAPIKYVNC